MFGGRRFVGILTKLRAPSQAISADTRQLLNVHGKDCLNSACIRCQCAEYRTASTEREESTLPCIHRKLLRYSETLPNHRLREFLQLFPLDLCQHPPSPRWRRQLPWLPIVRPKVWPVLDRNLFIHLTLLSSAHYSVPVISPTLPLNPDKEEVSFII